MGRKMSGEISYNMSKVKNKDSKIEIQLRKELWSRGLRYQKNVNGIIGKPDILFKGVKVAVFCDSEFWHGYNWEERKEDFKSNREFWIPKIERNIERDEEVNEELSKQGWKVLRFWGKDIKKRAVECADIIEKAVKGENDMPYRMIDLCAGIGGIRRGFELAGGFNNVLSAEIDKYACMTYEHLYGENSMNDITTEEFKEKVENTEYDILLAGFPCQAFSRAGKQLGFLDNTRGTLFFDIADILKRTRPKAFMLENVDSLITHDKGNTFKILISVLVNELDYKVIGVTKDENGVLQYDPRIFVRNSRNFGVPQNRPRIYIMGFDRKYFGDKVDRLGNTLPEGRKKAIYRDLNDLLEMNADPNFFLSSGYVNTLEKHRARHESKGNGFGYIIVNLPEIEYPVSNALLATGGSGKERNLVIDKRGDIAGMEIPTKHTPLNERGIRVMTPREWGKLQGFINYAFIDKNGNDRFSFPIGIANGQQYKQFGNAVTIPAVEKMALFMKTCLKQLEVRGAINEG